MLAETKEDISQTDRPPSWRDRCRFPLGATLLIIFTLFSGMGAYCFILTMPIYMASILGFSDTQSTSIYHAKSGVSYLLNVFGAVLADSLLGRVKCCLIFMPFDMLLMLGIALMAIYRLTAGIVTFYFLLAIIGGLIGPAVRTVIADQIPSDNSVMLSTYLHIIYFVNNFGIIVIAFSAPIMHKDIYCFGMECYPLVFTVSLILTASSFSLFLLGYCSNKLVIKQPTNNLFVNIFRCVSLAVKRRITLGKPVKGKSFLDYANEAFNASFINDLKIAKGLLVFLLAHPLFWTVFEQMSSVWTLQAQYMDGMVSDSYVIKADQMVTLNPILVVILIPIFEIVIYPLLDRINVKVPYRIVAGQIFTALACVSMIFIQIHIDKATTQITSRDSMRLNVANLGHVNMNVSDRDQSVSVAQSGVVSMTLTKHGSISFRSDGFQWNRSKSEFGNVVTMVVDRSNSVIIANVTAQINGGYGNVRAISLMDTPSQYAFKLVGRGGINKLFTVTPGHREFGEYVKCGVGVFDISLRVNGSEKIMGSVILRPGESKLLILKGSRVSEEIVFVSELVVALPGIFWQFPAYVLVTIGEVLFNVNTGIFLYGEAPKSMKSILAAAQYVCIAIGNILILLLKQILRDLSGVYLFLVCGVLVTISGILTAILGFYYLKNKGQIKSDEERDLNLTKL